jgi:hypothetical protein
VEYAEQRRDKDYVFFEGGKSFHTDPWRIFLASRQLGVMSSVKGIVLEHRLSQIAAVVLLRQALERKFVGLIGVAVYDRKGQTPKVPHDYYYEFIKANAQYFDFKVVNFTLLRYIYDWCNVAVHQAVQPFAWQLPYAQEVSEGLFKGGPLTKVGKGWSVHGAVYIDDVPGMQARFAQHFIQTYDHGIWAIEFHKPEAATGTVG